jgi:hypothetical protein
MDGSFHCETGRLAELVQCSEELLRKADDIIDRARLGSDALASIVWKSRKHCETAVRLFDVLGKTTPAAPDADRDVV